MSELRIRRRHRLRQKEIESIANTIDATLGTSSFTVKQTVDMGEAPDFNVLFVDGALLGMVVDGTPFLTIRGILKYGATKRFITVDMGAVKFVANGADIMGPGIVEAEASIVEGSLVWIRDERNNRPLAIGRTIVPADELGRKPKGKAVLSLHHVGDKLWALEEDA